jgi:hypothetical protein
LWQMSSGNITAGKFTIYGVARWVQHTEIDH